MSRLIIWIASFTLLFCHSAIAANFSHKVKQVDPSIAVFFTKEHTQLKSGIHVTVNSSKGLGSGVIISADGKILTAAHMVHVADLI